MLLNRTSSFDATTNPNELIMKTSILIGGAAGLLLLVGSLSYVAGFRGGLHWARKEITQAYLDVAGASLASAQAPEANHQTKEYAKAQFYYYAHRSQHALDADLGPVDEKAIAGLVPFPAHADSPNDYYKKR